MGTAELEIAAVSAGTSQRTLLQSLQQLYHFPSYFFPAHLSDQLTEKRLNLNNPTGMARSHTKMLTWPQPPFTHRQPSPNHCSCVKSQPKQAAAQDQFDPVSEALVTKSLPEGKIWRKRAMG